MCRSVFLKSALRPRACATPSATGRVDAAAWRSWTTFREGRGEPLAFTDPPGQRAVEDALCAFLLSVFGAMQPRTRGDAVPQPKSALAVVSAVRRVHKRLHYALPPTPRVAQLSNALEVCIVRSDGPDALAASRKAPLTLELILGANDKASGLTVGGRIVDWEAPFWKCYRAAELALWFSGARKADLLTTTNTPFDRSRVSRAHLAFDDKGATLRLATTKADPTGAINAAYALVLADADGDGADGAAALRAYHAACPPRDDVPLGDQPLFAVEGVALSGELFEKIHRAILVNFLVQIFWENIDGRLIEGAVFP
jgi:hypothetical protein